MLAHKALRGASPPAPPLPIARPRKRAHNGAQAPSRARIDAEPIHVQDRGLLPVGECLTAQTLRHCRAFAGNCLFAPSTGSIARRLLRCPVGFLGFLYLPTGHPFSPGATGVHDALRARFPIAPPRHTDQPRNPESLCPRAHWIPELYCPRAVWNSFRRIVVPAGTLEFISSRPVDALRAPLARASRQGAVAYRSIPERAHNGNHAHCRQDRLDGTNPPASSGNRIPVFFLFVRNINIAIVLHHHLPPMIAVPPVWWPIRELPLPDHLPRTGRTWIGKSTLNPSPSNRVAQCQALPRKNIP